MSTLKLLLASALSTALSPVTRPLLFHRCPKYTTSHLRNGIEAVGDGGEDGDGALGPLSDLVWLWWPGLLSLTRPIAHIQATTMTRVRTMDPTITLPTTVAIRAPSVLRTSAPSNGAPATTPPIRVRGAYARI